MTETLAERIVRRLEEEPERRSLAYVGSDGGHRWRSRGEVLESGRRCAAALAATGMRPGDVGVIVSVEPRECASLVLGMILGGQVPLLVAPPAIQGVNSSLGKILRNVIERTGARLVILPEDMAPMEEELTACHPALRIEFGFQRLLDGEDGYVPAARSARDVAAMQLTSGTTGFPRIAVWDHRALLAGIDGMSRGMGVRSDDVYLNWTPLYHDMGLVNNFLHCQVAGIPLALMHPVDIVRRPALWLQALASTGATTTWSPNFGFALAVERVRDRELDGVRLDHVRGFWNAAERVHWETMTRFQKRFEAQGVRLSALKTNFGCVETVGGITFSDPAEPVVAERVDLEALRDRGVARIAEEDASAQWIVSCGRPYPGAELEILDEQGTVVPDGVIGDVSFREVAHLREYLGQPEATNETLQGDRVRTGDLGYKRNGELFWTGRKGERLNLQGKKLDPSELEPVLFETEGLRKGCFAAFGAYDEKRGTEVLVLLAELDPASGREPEEIARALRGDFATQLGLNLEELALVPKGTLTKTSSGKRRHRHFRELYLEGRLEVLFRSRAGRLGA